MILDSSTWTKKVVQKIPYLYQAVPTPVVSCQRQIKISSVTQVSDQKEPQTRHNFADSSFLLHGGHVFSFLVVGCESRTKLDECCASQEPRMTCRKYNWLP